MEEVFKRCIQHAEPFQLCFFPKHVADAMVKEADGDPRVLEALLGLDPGSLGENPIMIQPNKVDNLRIPSGNEGGSKNNIQWRPGGKTYPGGVPEAVIDPVHSIKLKLPNYGNREETDGTCLSQ